MFEHHVDTDAYEYRFEFGYSAGQSALLWAEIKSYEDWRLHPRPRGWGATFEDAATYAIVTFKNGLRDGQTYGVDQVQVDAWLGKG